ncbi:MAG: hypothetical protein R3F14_41065 [Polyangiaceae bacterium]
MRTIRPYLLATLLLAPAAAFAQGAPSKAGPPPAATTKASAPPAGTAEPAAAHEIATEVDAAMNDKALAQFKEGNALFRAAKYPAALAAYRSAWALDLKSQGIVRNLGITELELKMYRDAAEHLTIALRLSDPKDPKRSSIERDLAEARAKVGTLTVKVLSGTDPVDGVELVDIASGKKYETPLQDPIFVDPGKVTFRIRREGYESQEKVFELKAGESQPADIALTRAPGFDGRTGPGAPTGSSTAPVVTPRSTVPGFVVGGVGVAAAIAGGVLLGIGTGTPGRIDEKLPLDENGNSLCRREPQPGENAACEEARSIARSGSTMTNAGIGLLVGGGVLVAGAAIYLLLPQPKAKAGSTTVVPVVGQEGGGLLLRGSF